MKKITALVILMVLGIGVLVPRARATVATFDAVNAALNEFRNSLLQSQFVEEMLAAMDRLNQLKAQYLEMLRFNSGIDEILDLFRTSPWRVPSLTRGDLTDAFWNVGASVTSELDRFQSATGVVEIRESLEALTGKIPESQNRPYIPFDEMQVVDGFQMAQEIRQAGTQVRDVARSIADQAKTVSSKGAARLQTDALSRVIVMGQENQEALAKLIELEAVQVEQVSREEKRLENERVKYMNDAKDYLLGLLNGVS